MPNMIFMNGALKKANLIEGRKGPKGGYRLAAEPKTITANAILVALEGPLSLVACQNPTFSCPVENQCVSRSLWQNLQRNLLTSLQETTLADLR